MAASRKCVHFPPNTGNSSSRLLAVSYSRGGNRELGQSSIPLRYEDFRERKDAWHPLGFS